MARSVVMVAATIFSTMKRLFKLDKVTGMASVELWVVMTTLLLVTRFLIDSIGPRVYSSKFLTATVQVLALLNYNMVTFTIGQMQLSAARVNDYFQVWAVLLVTLQYSVKVGRPYIRSKQIPLLDLMSSFWAANLLRVQTTYLLKVPLWLIWGVNAARIVSYFFSSNKAEAGNQENTRLVADYMRYEHTLSASASTVRMSGYYYLVHGEDLLYKEILRRGRGAGPARYRVQLSPQHKKLVTLEKIWNINDGESGLLGSAADPGNRLKDVCLSFALYKLLRRRFYDLPIHEAKLLAAREKTRQLVFEYILQEKDNYERALRVTEVELSFLRDTFYSRHAATFADGFPFLRMLLSLLLVVAIGYIAYPVRYIPERIDPADKNQITHGVFITRFIIGLIIAKELWEIYIYAFAPWTKVQLICMYIKHQRLQRPLVEKAMRLVFCLVTMGKWNHQIGQYNLLISSRKRMVNTARTNLRAEVQKAIFDSFKGLQQDPQRLDSYLSNAFGSNKLLSRRLAWTDELEADTHKILVWHIATCLCEISLAGEAKSVKVFWLRSRPLLKETRVPKDVWGHYITAVTLSNYCAYLLTKALVPDNGLVANRVFNEVRREARFAIFRAQRSKTLHDIYERLMKIVKDPMEDTEHMADEELEGEEQGNVATQIGAEEQINQDVNDEPREGDGNYNNFKVVDEPHHEEPERGTKGDNNGFDNTIIKMGSELGLQLIDTYTDHDQEDLWRDLAKFWTGFLLHLAASTRAAKHKTHLTSAGELITHLWALLSHAGFLGNVSHGEQLLDQDDLDDVNPLS